jgi:PqqD family protein of HPr-rel-A system
MCSDRSPVYVANQSDLVWEEWDDRYALFHRPSQKTHYLNATSAIALQCLAETALSPEGLADTLALEAGKPVSEELRVSLRKLLQRLETQGLVWRVEVDNSGHGT